MGFIQIANPVNSDGRVMAKIGSQQRGKDVVAYPIQLGKSKATTWAGVEGMRGLFKQGSASEQRKPTFKHEKHRKKEEKKERNSKKREVESVLPNKTQ